VLPLAHAGHYFAWALYALPVLIVVGSIVRNAIVQRRREGDEP
jgi:hypothetical protein